MGKRYSKQVPERTFFHLEIHLKLTPCYFLEHIFFKHWLRKTSACLKNAMIMKENAPSHTFTCKGPQKIFTEYSPDVKFCSELVDWGTSPPPKKTRLCASYSNEGLLDRSLNNLKGESIRTWCVMSFVTHEKIFCLERPNSCLPL